FLVYRYATRHRFYKRLEKPLISFDESFQETGDVPIAKAFDALIKSQYMLYHKRISEIEAQKEEHLTLIDRWAHQMKTPLCVIEYSRRNRAYQNGIEHSIVHGALAND